MGLIDDSMLSALKMKINKLFLLKKPIHVNYGTKRKNVRNALCYINGVYDNFLCVESKVNDYFESFTITYVQILIKEIEIIELND